MLKPVLMLLLHQSCVCATTAVPGPSLCARACTSALSVRFSDSGPPETILAHSCRSRLALSSRYLCLQRNCGAQVREAALAALNATCRDLLGAPLPSPLAVGNYTPDDIGRVASIDREDCLDRNKVFGHVVTPSPELFRVWLETLEAADHVRRHHALYGFAVSMFWVAVVAIGTANKLFLALSRLCCSRNSPFPKMRILATNKRWLKRKVVIPATFGYRCAQNVWWCTIPPRIQTLTIITFLLINIYFCFAGYIITSENFYFPTREKQMLRYVSDRTGNMAFCNFPVIWLFGMRNNLAIWLTGWSGATFNNFHRWAARIATLEVLVHGLAHSIWVLREGGWRYFAQLYSQLLWGAGQIAAVLMCAIVALSVYWMRRHHYETFLILHIALSFLVLLAMLGHVSIFKGKFDVLFWIPVSIWVLDRLARIVRIIAFSPRSCSADALAVYHSAADMIRLSISVGQAAYRVRPGTYYYLMALDGSRCWESHPFTVASVCSPDSGFKLTGEQVPLLETDEPLLAGEQGDGDVMNFIIRPCNSFTLRLRDMAASQWPHPASLRILVEGPYGHTKPLDRFDHVLFIVGGSGVATPLSYLASLSGVRQGQGQRQGPGPKSIQIHWATREQGFATDLVLREMGEALRASSVLTVHLYTPGPAAAAPALPDRTQQHARRLETQTVVESAAAGVAADERLAVVACGPASLADDARAAVVDALGRTRCDMDYFEESW